MRTGALLLAAALLGAALAERPPHWRGRRRGGFVKHHDEEENAHVHTSRAGVSGTATIQQKIDHFNASDARTFTQYYFFNDQNNHDKTVNFLYLSGEQTASVKMITGDTKPIVIYASKFAANLFALEHRYYGQSHPFTDTSTENLKYLSSRQAIEDIAAFIKMQNANANKPDDQKWIIVGGSYAGALSAWARMLHPELIAGSIASSAPILAQYDFYGYLETVDKNLHKYTNCAEQMKAGIEAISNLFETPNGRKTLDSKFPVNPKLQSYTDLQDNDIVTFFTWVTDAFEGASQYGDPGSVKEICDMFTAGYDPDHPNNGYDPVDALAKVLKNTNRKDFTFDVSYAGGIDDMRNTSYSEDVDYTGRLWTWQTCTEFGYFQSTDRGYNDNIFGSTVPINIYVDECTDVFGLDPNTVKQSIDDTNAYYGERDYYKGTNVFFAHGSVDPWSYLTKQLGTAQHWSVVTVEIQGGTHCSDLNPAVGTGYDDELKRVQALTQQNIEQWLNGPFTAPDSIKLTDNVGKRPNWFDGFVPAPLSITQNDPADAVANNRAKRSVSQRAKKAHRLSRWNHFTGKGKHFLLPPPPVEAMRPDLPDNVKEAFLDQPWDHFNTSDDRQFRQRFFVNEIYVKTDANGVKSRSAPNFLMIGGEGPESDAWVKNEKLAWMTYAKEVGANVYILEHRYYGASKLGTDLQFLTSSQMLYDVARFISYVKSQRQTGPWITFGGSYPGALAAWSREWFPELILGAVGSSGPVLAKNDFYEYLQVVENVLNATSQKCADRTREAFDKLRMLTRDGNGRAQISKKFNLKPDWSNVNAVVPQDHIQNVFANLYGFFQDVVQYSDDNNSKGNEYKVSELCSYMEDDEKFPDSLDAVRWVQMWVLYDYGTPSTGSDPQKDFNDLKDMLKYIDGSKDENGDRPWSDDDLSSVLWTWQTCNEFGYYQTTDYGTGIFGNPVPLNFFVEMCEQVFGVTMDHIEKGVARSNYQYGGRARYSATNVVLPNGNHDPWHALGILEQGNLDPSVVPILIEGTAHCADMYAARDNELPQLIAARNTILSNIKKWLNGGQPDTPTVATQAPPDPTTTTDSAGHLSTLIAMLAPIVALLVL